MHEKSLCHVFVCKIFSQAHFMVRNMAIRPDFTGQVQTVEQVVECPVEQQLRLLLTCADARAAVAQQR
jgi:hypothetical protein